MVEIYPNLYVGPEGDFYNEVEGEDGWWVVQAANEPFYREAVGCHGSEITSDHPEYLYAIRGTYLMLNLVDAPIEVDIPKEIFDVALDFIDSGLKAKSKVLVHCNQGISRSASIALLYLLKYTSVIPQSDCDEGMKFYEGKIYPKFSPGKAIHYYLTNHWSEYANPKKKEN